MGATVEAWYGIMDDCLRQLRPNDVCFEIKGYIDFEKFGMASCGSNLAYVFF